MTASNVSQSAVYKLLRFRQKVASSCHPNDNGGVKCVNHTMAQMVAMDVNEHQDTWDEQTPHIEFAYNRSVSAASGLAPNEVDMGRISHLSLTTFERAGVAGRQCSTRDHLA